jgi:Flp pilus assembly protein protease CpaA
MSKHTTQTVTGVVGALVLLLAGARLRSDPLLLARLAILGTALGQIALYDLRERRIPNRIVLPATGICAVLSLADGIHPSPSLLAGTALVALLLGVSLFALAALGMGDVKLALLLLTALGTYALLALVIGIELYALIGLFLLVRWGRAALGTSLPLAPIIAASCLLAVLL